MTTALPIALYPFAVADGARQMAFDDAMLDAAADSVASFRFYGWQEPTLSLGYFQPAAEHAILPQVPWLRRATGGAAILHGDGDITYSLALPAARQWYDGEPWLCRMHHILQRALRGFGAVTKTVACGEEKRLGPILCFQDHTAGDVLLNDVKVIGSAQRKHRGALLQHGTIRLQASKLLPQLPGLFAEPVDQPRLMNAILDELQRETKWLIQKQSVIIERPPRDRYTDPEWNHKR